MRKCECPLCLHPLVCTRFLAAAASWGNVVRRVGVPRADLTGRARGCCGSPGAAVGGRNTPAGRGGGFRATATRWRGGRQAPPPPRGESARGGHGGPGGGAHPG